MSFIATEVSEKEIEVIISPKSKLYIKGTSNVNTFKCTFDAAQFQEAKQVHYRKKGNRLHLDGAILNLQNKSFDCGNNGINKDFHRLLKTEQFPHIELEVKEINLETNSTKALVNIRIAGIQKSYEVEIMNASKESVYDGLLCVNIKDFDLSAPKKLMGLIAVHEDIEINFNLMLEF